MPYRDTATYYDALISARETLLATAARGRHRLKLEQEKRQSAAQRADARAQRAAKRKHAAAGQKEARAARVDRRRRWARITRSMHWIGLLAHPGWLKTWCACGSIFLAFAMPLLLCFGSHSTAWLLLTGFVMMPTLVFFITRTLLAHLVNREQRWLAALPFEMPHYLWWLGAENDKMAAHLTFHRDAPPPELLRDLLAADDLLDARSPEPRRQPRTLTVQIPQKGGCLLSHDNHGYRRWIHGLVQAAIQLHTVHPVREISFTSMKES